VSYDRRRYQASVDVTAEVLSAHGVNSESRVWVAHPFDPWAIGPIFRDAALVLGAWVVPTGLVGGEPSVLSLVLQQAPDVVCAPAGLLVRWLRGAKLPASVSSGGQGDRIVFHAGEPLLPPVARECAKLWKGRLVNIYGLAEFDTVAAESNTCDGSLRLTPRFDYRLRLANGRAVGLRPGGEGTLLIRRGRSGTWHDTRDLVRIACGPSRTSALWPETHSLQLLGRSDLTLKLPDGSSISEEQVLAAARGLRQVTQLQVRYARDLAAVTVVFESARYTPALVKTVKSQLLERCVELADSVKHGVVSLKVRRRATVGDRTSRGKLVTLLETK
jgi:phenylacetate-coenzyme A ligase PaaK-like adenylate-forming protein